MLNDMGTAGYPVPIAAAARVGGVVTVTTQQPHGLVNQDTVIISGVGGAFNLNGNFLATYIDTYRFNYLSAGSNGAGTPNTGTAAGSYDVNGIGLGVVYTDPILMPYLNSAYRKVQRALAMTGTTTFREDNLFLTVPAVSQVDPTTQVSISDSTAPPNQLPPDLIVPLKIWERQANSGTGVEFFPMYDCTNDGGLPPREQVQNLLDWEWRQDAIYFVGATQDVQIRLRYQGSLPVLQDGMSTILIRNAQEVCAYYTAAQASGAKGSPMSAGFATQFDDSLEDMIAAATRQQQDRPRRRLPYSSKNGCYGGGGWY